MFKRNVLAVSMAVAGLCSAQAMAAVVGGGATLPQNLYNTATVLPSGFNAYIGVGSGAGKSAVLTNDSTKLGLAAGITVDYAGSDSILSASEISTYQAAHQSPAVPTTSAANWGPLVQVPSAATSVTIPYKLTLAGGAALNNLDLTSAQLCDIFSGTITTWNQVNASYPSTPITVVYRAGSSGTTEIFTRHLNSQCSAKFTANSTFTTANVGAEPASWIAATGSANLASTVASTEGAIGYVGPEDVDATNNAVVAKVNGLLPTIGNVTTALSTIAPPSTAADRADPSKWVPVLANPASGYKIVGYTNLVFSQCYKDSADQTAIRNFINRHYTLSDASNNDDEIIANKLIPLTDDWKTAVRNSFFLVSSSLAVGNTTACTGIGRPL
ncbi:alkaline phosphatase L [Pseudomonas tohonis]|uniref:Phosphate-binding protein PstS n=1 Tax=Pseudomonas tohonis TaxID=2725477 RepID=A0A6J4E965_9PSED|nr:substrate-binding domain-containing protein [Pseudomonas tohonis]BCG25061.1 alkaline phosphatase L [Pseudomonas tohonis]GJN54217.1 alkaline phosphatase L [Pseudomonas tohonis]